ncbi:unnamed protein product [Ilex paraguariensis]|uniref:F-box/LRR-repeat protein 15/At3g58940/PEG3-like LRR domain-containing protein n=1 Tax=Ilex paraguariensis TaxID=185542 RepID=A0ABC8SUL6_9AQUA
MEDIDGLSPEEKNILGFITSFLDNDSVVQASLASDGCWKFAWDSLTAVLDFEYGPSNTERNLFTMFVNGVLAHRDNSPISMLRFAALAKIDTVLIEKCVQYALIHHARELDIGAFCDETFFEMPSEFYISQSLRVLKLSNATPTRLILNQTVALTNLKFLQLKNFLFTHQNFNAQIFSGCPNLETLVLRKCAISPGDKLKVLNVSGDKLKKIEILPGRFPWAYVYDQRIEICAPRLACFKCQGTVPELCFKGAMPCLDSLYIDLSHPSSYQTAVVDERKEKMEEILINMIGDLCNMIYIFLSSKTIEILSAIPNLCERGASTFGNLRSQSLRADNRHTDKNGSFDATVDTPRSSASEESLVSEPPKEHNLPTFCNLKCPNLASNSKGKDLLSVPSRVMSYLLQSFPHANSITFELTEVSSDEED